MRKSFEECVKEMLTSLFIPGLSSSNKNQELYYFIYSNYEEFIKELKNHDIYILDSTNEFNIDAEDVLSIRKKLK